MKFSFQRSASYFFFFTSFICCYFSFFSHTHTYTYAETRTPTNSHMHIKQYETKIVYINKGQCWLNDIRLLHVDFNEKNCADAWIRMQYKYVYTWIFFHKAEFICVYFMWMYVVVCSVDSDAGRNEISIFFNVHWNKGRQSSDLLYFLFSYIFKYNSFFYSCSLFYLTLTCNVNITIKWNILYVVHWEILKTINVKS